MANRDALIKLQAEFYQLQGTKGNSDRLNEIKNKIENGVMNMLGITSRNEEFGKILGQIKDAGLKLSKERPKSMVEKGLGKVKSMITGKQYGGDIKRYTQPRKVTFD